MLGIISLVISAIFTVIMAIISAFICAIIAKEKNLNDTKWFFLGLLMNVAGIMTVAKLPSNN